MSKSQSAPKLEPSWLKVIDKEFDKEYMTELRSFLLEDKKTNKIFPENKDIFNAFWKTPFNQVQVVILGQDPYHGPGQAHGLCFSVKKGVPAPPSLMNIFKEIKADVGIDLPSHGELTSWAEQGVLLLNTVLTVREHRAHSHGARGWETFTDRVIEELNGQRENLVFVLWGRPAQSKKSMIDDSRHLVLEASHPSPLSSYRGFFGCKHFSAINEYLLAHGQKSIDWKLED